VLREPSTGEFHPELASSPARRDPPPGDRVHRLRGAARAMMRETVGNSDNDSVQWRVGVAI
jgi:hypothetical protein